MIGPGIARELARQRELAIAREAERPRMPRGRRGGTSIVGGAFLPSASIVVAVLVLVALGAPMP